MHELELGYRRLLLAYPRDYRVERGPEILTTLMDAAAPGARRPSLRDTLDLVLSGLWFRFSPPRGRRHRVTAALTSVFIGLVLAGFAATWAWASQPTTPWPEHKVDLLTEPRHESFYHPAPIWSHEHLSVSPPRHEGWTGPQPAPAHVLQIYQPDATLDSTMSGLYERMQREGWRVGEFNELFGFYKGHVFWASRDGVIVRVEGHNVGDVAPTITVRTHLVERPVAGPVAIGTLAFGVVAGWLVACGLLRRAPRVLPAWRRTAAVFAWISLAGQAILVPVIVVRLVMLHNHWGWAHYHWLSPLGTLLGTSLLTFLTFAGLAASALIVRAAPPAPVEVSVPATHREAT